MCRKDCVKGGIGGHHSIGIAQKNEHNTKIIVKNRGPENRKVRENNKRAKNPEPDTNQSQRIVMLSCFKMKRNVAMLVQGFGTMSSFWYLFSFSSILRLVY